MPVMNGSELSDLYLSDKLTRSAKYPALYPVTHQDLGKAVPGWLRSSLGKMDELLLIWVKYG